MVGGGRETRVLLLLAPIIRLRVAAHRHVHMHDVSGVRRRSSRKQGSSTSTTGRQRPSARLHYCDTRTLDRHERTHARTHTLASLTGASNNLLKFSWLGSFW